MELVIIGAGAIGGLIGAKLAKGGVDVTLVDTAADHVAAIRAKGMTILSPEGQETIPVKAYTVTEFLETRKAPLTYVMVSVKSHFTRIALEPFVSLLDESSTVISIQNGLNAYEIADLIGAERTLLGFVNIFSDYMEPGIINYGGKGALALGEFNGQLSPRLAYLEQELKGLDRLEISTNVLGYLWGKIGYAAILEATTLTNETMADIIDDPRYRVMLMDLASEILEIAELEGIELPEFDDWNPADAWPRENRDLDCMNRQLDLHVARLRTYTKVHSGIWRDIAVRKRKIEVFATKAPVLRIAEKYGKTLPLNQVLMQQLRRLESGQIGFDTANLDILLETDRTLYH